MATDMQKARDRATQFVSGFTPGQKAMSVIAVVVALVGGLIFSHYAGKPSYQPLFTGLKTTDASAITTKLSSDGVPYQLTDQGATILVPGKDVDSERLAMSAAGLPAQGGGFSDLDKQGLTSSTASQQAAYQDDLQNELQSTIQSIQGVTSAQVEIALPQTDTFGVATASTTTASVLVGLSGGTTLSSTQIESVVNLVAGAVPNLDPSNVTVADTSGNILAAPGVSTASSGDSTQTKTFDTDLSQSLTTLLGTVAGVGNVQVQVAGDLDYNETTTQSQTIPNGKNGKPVVAPTSSSKDSEIYKGAGAGAGAGGTLGTTTGTGTTTTSGSGNYKKTSTSHAFAVSTVNQTIKQAPGTIKRLSVAVLLNSSSNLNPTQVKSLVDAAAGIQAKRGDTVNVVSMPFSKTSATAAKAAAASAAKAQKSAGMVGIIKTALLVIGIIVVLLLLIRNSKKERRSPVALPLEPSGSPDSSGQASIGAGATRMAIPGPRTSSGGMNEFIDSSPDEIADLLRSWTREGAH